MRKRVKGTAREAALWPCSAACRTSTPRSSTTRTRPRRWWPRPTSSQDVTAQAKGKKKSDVATLVGKLVAKRAKEKGVSKVVFDRGGYPFHGRIKALAEAARAGGLEF